MVAVPQEPVRMTETEYLEYERHSEFKHEYAHGEVFAMTGASLKHNVICMNIGTTLNNQLIDRDCIVTSSDLRLKVSSEVTYRYPDVMVICGEPVFTDDRLDTILNPTILLQFLSPSTALVDRNEKLREYRQIDSLQAYLLVSQSEPRIERFLRQDVDHWLYSEVTGLEKVVEIPPIGCTLALSTVYNKVSFEGDSNRTSE